MSSCLGVIGFAGLALAASTFAGNKVAVWNEGPQAGHYLVWRGRPMLLVGDSITQGWMECGTNLNQTAYLDALASRGINLLMLWAYKGTSAEMQRSDRRIGYDAPELWPWMGSPDDRSFDLRRFNPAYFGRLKAMVAYAERKGLVVLITVHDGWTKTCFNGHPFNRALGNGPLANKRDYVRLADYDHELPEAFDGAWNWRQQNQFFQERFCAKLIAELLPFSNVLFEMFNEGEWYDPVERHRHEQHFLAFFRARCDNLLLSNSDGITGDTPHQDVKVDIITLHPQGWVGRSEDFQSGFRSLPPKPYLYSEPVPEFDGVKPPLAAIRRSMWETTLAGAGWVNQNDPSFGWDARAAIAARAEARDAAYATAGHCARFFNHSGIAFWKMQPSGKLSSSGSCLAQPGEEYIIYATNGPVSVDLTGIPTAELAVRWFNPRNGGFHPSAAIAGGALRELSPPFEADAVLHLKRAKL